MTDQFEKAVRRAIAAMQDDLGASLTVDDMARAAMFSKFHFTRIFQRVTGVSPGRFLSALRLQQAKVLLVSTSLNVADISVRVGYNSVGTFSSRFTRSVGLSPTAYRRLGGVTHQVAVNVRADGQAPSGGVVTGIVSTAAPGHLSRAYLGLFPGRIPEGRPVAWAAQRGPGPFVLDKVPAGEWYLLAQGILREHPDTVPHSVPGGAPNGAATGAPSGAFSGAARGAFSGAARGAFSGVPNGAAKGAPGGTFDSGFDGPHGGPRGLLVGSRGPIEVRDHTVVAAVDIQLRPVGLLDPPVLLALPT